MKTKLLFIIASLLLVFFFSSCGAPKSAKPQDEDITEEVEVEYIPQPKECSEKQKMSYAEPEEPEPVRSSPKSGKHSGKKDISSESTTATEVPKEIDQPKLDDYEFVLRVTEVIPANKTGTMTVWIGNPKYKPVSGKGIISDSSNMPADIGQYAKITPIAHDFEVDPQSSGCIRIHPSGSSISFTLFPKKGLRRSVNVSALIELFEGEDCTGVPIPKTTQILSVNVKLDILSLLEQVFDICWDHFTIFLGSLLGLLATIILFKIRKKSKIDETKTD